MAPVKLWTLTAGGARNVARTAERAEAAGWHGLAVVDSQNLSADSYVSLAFAAAATEPHRPRNRGHQPRHPTPRGDGRRDRERSRGFRRTRVPRDRPRRLGARPPRAARRPACACSSATWWRSRPICAASRCPFSALAFHEQIAPEVSALGLADTPAASRLAWLDRSQPKVPVEVAATGARVIAVAARHADRVLFALGADPERIAWGIETARRARREAGLDPAGIAFGSYVNCAAHPEIDVARGLVRGGLTTFARFAVMHGTVSGPATAEQREVLGALHRGYDMTQHTRADSPQAELLTPAFVDRYAVVGPPDTCVRRLRELAALGLDKFVVIGPTAGADRDAARAAEERFAAEVLPAFATHT